MYAEVLEETSNQIKIANFLSSIDRKIDLSTKELKKNCFNRCLFKNRE